MRKGSEARYAISLSYWHYRHNASETPMSISLLSTDASTIYFNSQIHCKYLCILIIGLASLYCL